LAKSNLPTFWLPSARSGRLAAGARGGRPVADHAAMTSLPSAPPPAPCQKTRLIPARGCQPDLSGSAVFQPQSSCAIAPASGWSA